MHSPDQFFSCVLTWDMSYSRQLQTLDKIRKVLAEFRLKPVSRGQSSAAPKTASSRLAIPAPASQPQPPQPSSHSQPLPEPAAAEGEAGGSREEERLTVQYLSSSRLMGVQMANPDFRRHFLVQCLVLLQACDKPIKPATDQLRQRQVRLGTVCMLLLVNGHSCLFCRCGHRLQWHRGACQLGMTACCAAKVTLFPVAYMQNLQESLKCRSLSLPPPFCPPHAPPPKVARNHHSSSLLAA